MPTHRDLPLTERERRRRGLPPLHAEPEQRESLFSGHQLMRGLAFVGALSILTRLFGI